PEAPRYKLRNLTLQETNHRPAKANHARSDVDSLRSQRALVLGVRMVRHEIKDHVVLFAIHREIFSCVIDDCVCADRSDHLHIPRTANTGNLRAKRLRDLYSKCTNTTGGAIDQNLLA